MLHGSQVLATKTLKQVNMPSSCLLTGYDSSGIRGCVSSPSVALCKTEDQKRGMYRRHPL